MSKLQSTDSELIFFVHFKCKLCWDGDSKSYKIAKDGNYTFLGESNRKWVHLLPETETDQRKMISVPNNQIILKERRM